MRVEHLGVHLGWEILIQCSILLEQTLFTENSFFFSCNSRFEGDLSTKHHTRRSPLQNRTPPKMCFNEKTMSCRQDAFVTKVS